MATAAMGPTVQEDVDEELQQLLKDEAEKQMFTDLMCPYCGITYSAKEGCFCFRIVGWDDLYDDMT